MITLPELLNAVRAVPEQGVFFAGYAFSIALVMSTRIYLQERKEREQAIQERLAGFARRHRQVRSLDTSPECSVRMM